MAQAISPQIQAPPMVGRQPSQLPPSTQVNVQGEEKKSKKWVWIILAIALVLGVSGLIYWLL